MTKFRVIEQRYYCQDWTYEVEAENAEEAKELVLDDSIAEYSIGSLYGAVDAEITEVTQID